MRRSLLTLLASVVLALPAISADAPRAATPLGADLLLFEQAVKWDVVSQEWVARRPGWLEKVGRSTDPRELAAMVAQLEGHMGWSSVKESWRERRDGWLAGAKRADTLAAGARLLLELEAVTRWEAVQPAWKDVRPAWEGRLTSIAKGR